MHCGWGLKSLSVLAPRLSKSTEWEEGGVPSRRFQPVLGEPWSRAPKHSRSAFRVLMPTPPIGIHRMVPWPSLRHRSIHRLGLERLCARTGKCAEEVGELLKAYLGLRQSSTGRTRSTIVSRVGMLGKGSAARHSIGSCYLWRSTHRKVFVDALECTGSK